MKSTSGKFIIIFIILLVIHVMLPLLFFSEWNCALIMIIKLPSIQTFLLPLFLPPPPLFFFSFIPISRCLSSLSLLEREVSHYSTFETETTSLADNLQ